METVIGNIRRIIKEKGIKQRHVAELANIHERDLSSMLHGRKKITAEHAAVFARVLNVTPNELFGVGESVVQ